MKEYFLENTNWEHVIIYLVAINIIGFLAMGFDKWKAKRGDWRTPEKGGIGTILGMYTFRHKTKKLKFTVGMPTILIAEIVAVIYFFIK